MSRALGRLDEPYLAIPGVIGVASEWSGRCAYVAVGRDAGFPGFQPLDEWKTEVALVATDALTLEQRRAAKLRLPADELADADAWARELASFGGARADDDGEAGALEVAARAALQSITDEQRQLLTSLDVPFWIAGYTRHSSTLWLHHHAGVDVSHAFVALDDSRHAPSPFANAPLARECWADRVLRALSGGVIGARALAYARRRAAGWTRERLLDDDLARAGLVAAERIADGDSIVDIPLHGRVRQQTLPPFTIWVGDRQDAQTGRQLSVPRADVWA